MVKYSMAVLRRKRAATDRAIRARKAISVKYGGRKYAYNIRKRR